MQWETAEVQRAMGMVKQKVVCRYAVAMFCCSSSCKWGRHEEKQRKKRERQRGREREKESEAEHAT